MLLCFLSQRPSSVVVCVSAQASLKGGAREPSPHFGTKRVFNKHTIKVWVRCIWWCPGNSVPNGAHFAVSLFQCSSESNARVEVEGVSSKSPSRVLVPRLGCWEERKRRVSPRWGVIDLPTRQINDFLPICPPPIIWLLASSLFRLKKTHTSSSFSGAGTAAVDLPSAVNALSLTTLTYMPCTEMRVSLVLILVKIKNHDDPMTEK